MVKKLNPEWELFGPRYSVDGAKVERVNCNACNKQVSASVNRLQSHLRLCPARPITANESSNSNNNISNKNNNSNSTTVAPPPYNESPSPYIESGANVRQQQQQLGPHHSPEPLALGHSLGNNSNISSSNNSFSTPSAATQLNNASANVVDATSLAVPSAESLGFLLTSPIATTAAAAVPVPPPPPPTAFRNNNNNSNINSNKTMTAPTARPIKRQKQAPANGTTSFLTTTNNTTPGAPALVVARPTTIDHAAAQVSTTAYYAQRLAIEEKRLSLALQQHVRDERRDALQLEILTSQARKERLAADKEAYESKVVLALSRKKLRDQGVSEVEIEQILPVGSDGSDGVGSDRQR